MGVVQNSIDIQKIIEAGGDPTIAAKVAELEAEIGDENSGIIKDIDDLQEANALIMTSVSAIKTTADSAKARADQAVLWSERKGYVGKNFLKNQATSQTLYGITYTVNADKSVSLTAGGKATVEAGLNIFPTSGYLEKSIPEGTYILSDGGVGTNGAYLFFARKKGSSGTAHYTSIVGEKEITIDYSQYDYFNFQIHVVNGYTIPAGGLTFYPMLRLSSISNSAYEPYLQSNEELDTTKLDTSTLKSVTAAAADFAAFKAAIAAL